MTRPCFTHRQRIRWALPVFLAVLFIAGVPLAAKQKKKTHAVHRRNRRSTAARRYRHVSIQPDRVQEIQKALARAGFYHDEPNGRWDGATRDAMREFQKQNGFAPTGLPEAKPLLLLGLGPHPLPPGLGPLGPEAGYGSQNRDTETSEASASPAVK
ncbi:MAG: peptidoglycan-binding protein [Acidobacteria bacterium]|nr:MAG: peptidoglycan-binding protein [Acidobacteriota bacterium]